VERSASPIIGGPEAEARHATIVKCDLVASTRAKRQLDLEAQFKFQRRFHETIAKIAEKHGAHIDGFEGDGALLVVGFPNPREDAAESAVRMGLDLIDAVRTTELIPNVHLQSSSDHQTQTANRSGGKAEGARRPRPACHRG